MSDMTNIQRTEDLVALLPSYAELEERFNLLVHLSNSDELYGTVTRYDAEDYRWLFWDDGGGNYSVLLLLKNEPKALLFGFDHESENSFYPDDDYAEKQIVFDGLPAEYKRIVDSNVLVQLGDGRDFTFATNAFWLNENGEWEYNPEAVKEFDFKYEDGGMVYTLGPYFRTEEEVRKYGMV